MKKTPLLIVTILALMTPAAWAANFTPGNIVVLQIGNTDSAGSAGMLREYTPSGTEVGTGLALPYNGTVDNGGSIAFCNSSGWNHSLNLSYDGALILIPAFANAVASGTVLNDVTAAVSPRVVGTVRYDQVIARPISSAISFSTQGFRSATSDGIGNFWGMGGGPTGAATRYLNTETTIQGTAGRAVLIANGNFYYALGGIVREVVGLPTSANSGSDFITPNAASPSLGNFILPENPTVGPPASRAYLANTKAGDGVQRFDWNGSAYVYQYTIPMLSTLRAQHLAVDYSTPGTPTIYVVNTTGSQIQKIIDPGPLAANATVTPFASPAASTIFRGVVMAPTQPALPVFTQQPAGTTANYGDAVTFGPVAATGANPNAWTWKHGTDTLTDGGRISGATSTTLRITGVTAADAGSYYAIASNNGGSVSSDAAVLALTGSCISPQLVDITNAAGTTAEFTAGVSGCPAPVTNYTWTLNDTPLSDGPSWTGTGAIISGANTNHLTISGVQAGDMGIYKVTLVDAADATNISAASLTVVNPPSITVQPASITRAAGSIATFTVEATGGSLSYTWYKGAGVLGNGPTGTGATIYGAATSSLSVSNVQDGDAGTYSVTVANLAGSQPSDPATLTVVRAPSIVVAPTNTFGPAGSDAMFHVVADGTPTLNYQWWFKGNPLFDDGRIAGVTTDTLWVTNVSTADAGVYSVSVTSDYGMVSNYAHFVLETATPRPHGIPGLIVYDPFDYVHGTAANIDHISTVYNEMTGLPVYWAAMSGSANTSLSDNDLVNWLTTSQVGPGQYPWPGIDCNSVTEFFWTSAPNNTHLRFGGADQASGAVYFSFIFLAHQSIPLASGDYDLIGGFTSTEAANSWNYKLCTQTGPDNFVLGVFKGGGTTINSGSVNGQWASAKTLYRGQPHFVVGCYKFNSGTNPVGGVVTNDDIVSLWVDPPLSSFGASEANVPAADAGGMMTNWFANAPISDFGFRSSVPPSTRRVTDLRIGTTWASVTKPYYPKVTITTTPTDVTISWPAKDTPWDPGSGVYRGYRLQSAPNLFDWADDPTWNGLDTTGTNWTAIEGLSAPQFFRLRQPPR